VISGARIRRITKKMVEDAWKDDSMCTWDGTWDGTRLTGSRRLNS